MAKDGQQREAGLLGSVKEGVSNTLAAIRDLPVIKQAGQAWDFTQKELGSYLEQGAHEVASALFRGAGADGYVMYPRAGEQENAQQPASLKDIQGAAREQGRENEKAVGGPEKDRGMEM